jgi:hypothetical protein
MVSKLRLPYMKKINKCKYKGRKAIVIVLLMGDNTINRLFCVKNTFLAKGGIAY